MVPPTYWEEMSFLPSGVEGPGSLLRFLWHQLEVEMGYLVKLCKGGSLGSPFTLLMGVVGFV